MPHAFVKAFVVAGPVDIEKVDANKLKFVLPLKPREKQQFSYELTTNHGLNATR